MVTGPPPTGKILQVTGYLTSSIDMTLCIAYVWIAESHVCLPRKINPFLTRVWLGFLEFGRVKVRLDGYDNVTYEQVKDDTVG